MSEYAMKLPDVGEGVAEAEIVEWHVALGDTIDEDDVIADVMTDKATVELPSPVTGVVRFLGGEVGDVLPVGSVLVRIETDVPTDTASEVTATEDAAPTDAGTTGDEASGIRAPTDADEGSSDDESRDIGAPTEPSPAPVPPSELASHRAPAAAPRAAPAVRARARDLGLALESISGSGPDGRVLHADVDARLLDGTAPRRHSPPPRSTPTPGQIDDVAVRGLRRNIAQRMQASARAIPHFAYVEEVDVTEVERLRRDLNAQHAETTPTKLSMLNFVMRAVIIAVRTHPEMNARYDDEAGVVHRHHDVHLGIATQTDRGLMVPVVHHADRLDLWESAAAVGRLAAQARSAKIEMADLQGSTITITSLGALGGIASTPIINAPEVAIVGVNKIADRPVYVDDLLTRRKIMNLSSSFDHRVVDGADAAAFIQEVRRLLETPALLFVDR